MESAQQYAVGWGSCKKDNLAYPASHGDHYMLCRQPDEHMGGIQQTSPLKDTSHILVPVSHHLSPSGQWLVLRWKKSGVPSEQCHFSRPSICSHSFHQCPSSVQQFLKSQSSVLVGQFPFQVYGCHLCTSADFSLLLIWCYPPWIFRIPQFVLFPFL